MKPHMRFVCGLWFVVCGSQFPIYASIAFSLKIQAVRV